MVTAACKPTINDINEFKNYLKKARTHVYVSYNSVYQQTTKDLLITISHQILNMNQSNVTRGNSYCKYDELPKDVERAVKMAALLLVGGFGVGCNLFTIVLAAKYTVRRNLNFLIINMAVSDTLFIVIALIEVHFYSLGYKLWHDDTFGNFACQTIPFVSSTSQLASVVTLLIISIERYRITTRRAVQISRPYSLKQRVCLLAFSWLISAALNVFLVISAQSKKDGKCYMKLGLGFYYLLSYTIKSIITTVVFLVLAVLSILTLRKLSNPQAIEDNLSEVQRKLRRKRISSAVRMVLYSLLLYLCCYLPRFIDVLFYNIFKLFPWTNFLNNKCIDRNSLQFIIGYFLPVVNSSLSPCVYFLCLSDFREAAKPLLCRRNVTNNSRTTRNRTNPVQPRDTTNM